MSAGLDTIALAVAHLERAEAEARGSPNGKANEASGRETRKDDANEGSGKDSLYEREADNGNNQKGSRQSSPFNSVMIPGMPPRGHGFTHPRARMVSADHHPAGAAAAAAAAAAKQHPHTSHQHQHHPYFYVHHHHLHAPHHQHPHVHQPHPQSSPRSSPMTVYAPHTSMVPQGSPQQRSQMLPPPLHGHHYMYTTVPSPPGSQSNAAGHHRRPSPTPSPPPEERARSSASSPRARSTSPESEPALVFDMDELDRLLTNAIQMDIHKTPPAEVSKDEAISAILTNDVLCGRGGETNHHAGNIRYRQLVKICQPAYIAAKRRDKPKIAQRIVRAVRLLGGRFLKKVPEQSCWKDVGNGKAREKTSQALREGAPELRHGKEDEGLPKKRRGSPKPQLESEHFHPPPMMHSVLLAHHRTPRHYTEAPAPASVGSVPSNDISEGNPKKRRISSPQPAFPASVSTAVAVNASSYESPKASTDKATPLAIVSADRGSSPASCFTATISADDEDGVSNSNSTGNATSLSVMAARGPLKDIRGPRLKLLKRRLQAE